MANILRRLKFFQEEYFSQVLFLILRFKKNLFSDHQIQVRDRENESLGI